MEHDLPIIQLPDHPYKVDVLNERLVSTQNPEKVIWLAQTDYLDHHYVFHHGGTEVRIPCLCQLDPQRMAVKYGKALAEMGGLTDLDLVVDSQVLRDRLGGLLPEVKICGNRYQVNLWESALISMDKAVPSISFHKLKPFSDFENGRFWFPFNTQMKEVTWISHDLLQLPQDIVMVPLPPFSELDPVGYAKMYNYNLDSHLRFYPPRALTIVPTVPLSRTELASEIRSNMARDRARRFRQRLQQTVSRSHSASHRR